MPRFVRDDFVALVKSSIPDEALREQALQDVRLCLGAVDRERFPLRPQDDLDRKKLISVVGDIAEWDVTKVVAMSLDDPFPQPAWLSPHAHERSKGDIIGESFYGRFSRLPKNSVDDIALAPEIRTALYEAVQKSLCRRLKEVAEAVFRELLAKGVDANIGQNLRYGQCEILFRYLCFAAAGEAKETERFGKLLRKHVKSPILGLLRNGGERHEGTLLVLCA